MGHNNIRIYLAIILFLFVLEQNGVYSRRISFSRKSSSNRAKAKSSYPTQPPQTRYNVPPVQQPYNPNYRPSSGTGNGNIGWNVPPASNPYRPGTGDNRGNIGWNVPHQSAPHGVPHYNQNPSYPNSPSFGSHGYHNTYQSGSSFGGMGNFKPQANPQFPGYYKPYKPPKYSLARNLGIGAVGAFLGYSLARLTTPTYLSNRFYTDQGPLYDHYRFHHYYHDRDAYSGDRTVDQNSIMPCGGDSYTLCPAGLNAICTTGGTLMCVMSTTRTAPCSGNPALNCAIATVPCVNGINCTNPINNTTTLSIPCISTLTVRGNPYTTNSTASGPLQNNTAILQTGPQVFDTSPAPPANATTNETGSTVTPSVTSTEATVNAEISARRKRDIISQIDQNYCVTIVAVPARYSNQQRRIQGQPDSATANVISLHSLILLLVLVFIST